MKHTHRLCTLLALLLMLGGVRMQAQIRIDKQQCFGGYGDDIAYSIVEEENFFLVAGLMEPSSIGTGHIQCDGNHQRTWVAKISKDNYEFMEGWCFDIMSLFVKIFKDENTDGEYFLVGQWNCYGARNLTTLKIDSDGNELWRVCFGNEYGHMYGTGRLYTSDGGIINSGDYTDAGGDVSHIFGGYDGWLIKHDRNGNLEWELTLGSQAYEGVCTVQQASDGGYYVCMQNESYGVGNIPCPEIVSNATLVKLSQAGEIEWHECYGCANTAPERDENSAFIDVVELNDGYLFGGEASCNSGDLEGSGWHYGTLHNSPNGRYTSDIWLWKVDNNRNIIWSKCYGGSDEESLLKMFRTEDGGFIVFGNTHSRNGDVASASHINLDEWNEGVGWIFRIDANGNLLWERCLGSAGGAGSTSITDVIKHNDREYTVLGNLICPPSGSSGDVNCTNCAQLSNPEFPHHLKDYWLFHITDTVDYSTLSVPEMPIRQEASVEIYPNPTNNTVCVVLPNEAEATEMELVNMSGQVVAAKTFSGKSSWIEMGDLPKGMYMLRIRNAEICLTRKVLRE